MLPIHERERRVPLEFGTDRIHPKNSGGAGKWGTEPHRRSNLKVREQPSIAEFLRPMANHGFTSHSHSLEKMASIDAQMRLLAPRKVSEDDKLIEYDALLLDRFLDILQDLHGEDVKETVQLFSRIWN